MKSLFDPKFVWHTMFGYTLKYVIIFLVLFYLVLIMFLGFPKKYEETTTKMNSTMIFQENFCKSVKNWKKEHSSYIKVLSFFLGFFATTIMYRWWSQIIHMPRINALAIVLNGVVIPGN